MKALSIRQPWAGLIVSGFKDIENRTWSTNVRGRIYIHASATWAVIPTGVIQVVAERLSIRYGIAEDYLVNQLKPPQRGVIIGEVDIINCVRASESEWFDGPYGFQLGNPVVYQQPIPYKGRLGFFEVNL